MKKRHAKVFIVSVRHPGKFLILEKERDDLPGGGIEPNEEPKAAEIREAHEELPSTGTYGFEKPMRLNAG